MKFTIEDVINNPKDFEFDEYKDIVLAKKTHFGGFDLSIVFLDSEGDYQTELVNLDYLTRKREVELKELNKLYLMTKKRERI